MDQFFLDLICLLPNGDVTLLSLKVQALQEEMVTKLKLYNKIQLPPIQLQESLLHPTPKMLFLTAVRLLKEPYNPYKTFYFTPYSSLQAASVNIYFITVSVLSSSLSLPPTLLLSFWSNPLS